LRLFLHFLRVGIIQDKALAALAIEDKKRQYAAAEKHLEDVLQTALSNSG
jgi:HAUS augmin-like complex subunit 1